MPCINAEAMSLHLDEISFHVAPGRMRSSSSMARAGIKPAGACGSRTTSRSCRFLPIAQNSIRSRISGTICGKTTSASPSGTASIVAATPGTNWSNRQPPSPLSRRESGPMWQCIRRLVLYQRADCRGRRLAARRMSVQHAVDQGRPGAVRHRRAALGDARQTSFDWPSMSEVLNLRFHPARGEPVEPRAPSVGQTRRASSTSSG